jgi:small subunit ribosomal protein S9
MTEDPQQPEQPEAGEPEEEGSPGVPEESGEARPSEGVPGEPGEATPSETSPDPSDDVAAGGDAEPEGAEEPVGDAEAEAAEAAAEEPAEAGAPGPEIEGVEELAEAARPEAAPPAGERPRPGRRRRRQDEPTEEVIPGAHLEPDLVLEEQAAQEEPEYGEYAEYAEAEPEIEEAELAEEAPPEPQPVARKPLDLAADARYHATGKRKSAVARVILKPGEGTYRINGRHLDEYFPRVLLQRLARQPLEAAGYHTRMDVVARIHGGGVSAQATALRHGIARALVEADPALRGELKRRGYLTRDPRVKERKKAGLKKARKRPQFSKR